ncbi:MMPL family transporter [Streptomyces goshikiensis]|uniref:MMPL family transporter n=1 Tax=Streptomyces goshikiensis TaxID=1942 RepID=UPI00380203A8
MFVSVGRWCARRPKRTIAAWLLLLLALGAAVALCGRVTSEAVSIPGSDSQAAADAARAFPGSASGKQPLVLHTGAGGADLTSAGARDAVAAAARNIAGVDHVVAVTTPYEGAGRAAMSADGHTAFLSVELDVTDRDITPEVTRRIVDAARPAEAAGIEVTPGGSLAAAADKGSTRHSEIIGLLAALAILWFGFRSAVAATVPLIAAVVGLGVSLSVVGLLGHLMDMPSAGSTIAAMIGLGVGVDYSLFCLTRFRELLGDGASVEDAAALTTAASGKAVAFAGCAVVAALASLALGGLPLLHALALAPGIAVLVAVAATLTLLPALFALLGRSLAPTPTTPAPTLADPTKRAPTLAAPASAAPALAAPDSVALGPVVPGAAAVAGAVALRPAAPGPVTPDPTASDAAAADVWASGPAASGPAAPDAAASDAVALRLAAPDVAAPDPAALGPVVPGASAAAGMVALRPAAPGPVTPDPVTPDPVTPDPVTPDPVASDAAALDALGLAAPDVTDPDPTDPDSVALGPVVPGAAAVAGAVALRPAAPGPVTPDAAAPDQVAAGGAGWRRVAERVARQPWRHLIGALLLVAVLAAPAAGLTFGQLDGGDKVSSTASRTAYDRLASAFGPGVNGPLQVTDALPDPASGPTDPRVAKVTDALTDTSGVAAVGPPQLSPDGRTARWQVTPTTAPGDPETARLVHRLRETTLPAATAGTGHGAHVSGAPAAQLDLNDRLSRRMPAIIAFVLVIAALLLLLAFRSVVVAATAAVLNLVSVAAAYGVLTALFQQGLGAGALGLDGPVPIPGYVPLLMFAVLFGLSMDYEVFLLSAVREAYLKSGDHRGSVITGLARTGGIITSAALIMVCVFLSYLLSDDPVVKMFGIGLATAVALDATLVRGLLVPAAMILLGKANWWLPGWLDRALPRIDIEGGDHEPPPMAVPAPQAEAAPASASAPASAPEVASAPEAAPAPAPPVTVRKT